MENTSIKQTNKAVEQNLFKSKFIGVTWNTQSQLWCAGWTSPKGKTYYFGCFKTELEAAHAYDKHIAKFHNITSPLNFPEVAEEEIPDFCIDFTGA